MPSAEHEAMVAQIVATGQRTPEEPPGADELAAARRAEEAGGAVPPLGDVRCENVVVGGVPCIVVSPRDVVPSGTIVFVHGGGYIWMRAQSHLPVVAGLVRASGCRCVNVDYRRAPEHPYPAPVEDLVAVHRALVDEGVSPSRIAFAGDSAGGGLVIGGMVALRDAGAPLPVAAVSISPWTDLTVSGASAEVADDPLLDDARRVVERARECGVDVVLHEFEDVIHMWVVIGPDIPEALAAFSEAGEFVRTHLH